MKRILLLLLLVLGFAPLAGARGTFTTTPPASIDLGETISISWSGTWGTVSNPCYAIIWAQNTTTNTYTAVAAAAGPPGASTTISGNWKPPTAGVYLFHVSDENPNAVPTKPAVVHQTWGNLTVYTPVTTSASFSTTIGNKTFSTSAQTQSVTAKVTSNPQATGTVSFRLYNSSGATVGSAVTGTLSTSGNATATITIPANTAVASGYYVKATYSATTDAPYKFQASSANSATFSIQRLAVTTSTSITTTIGNKTFSTSAQTQSVTAKVTSNPQATGTVSFRLYNSSGATVGSAVTGTLSSGSATASVSIPANTPAGSGYYVKATYSLTNSGNYAYQASSANSSTFTIQPMSVTTATSVTTTIGNKTFSTSAQTQSVTAKVTSSPQATGTVSFRLYNSSGATVGSAVTGTLSSGNATATITIPANTAVASGYYVTATYSATTSGNYTYQASNADSNTFAIQPTPVTTSAAVTTVLTDYDFSTNSRTVSVTGTVTSSPQATGSVVFGLYNRAGTLQGSSVSRALSAGSATATITLPASLESKSGYYVRMTYASVTSGNYAYQSSSANSNTFAVKAAATNIAVGGTDLKDIFAPLTVASTATTGFRTGGADLNTVFESTTSSSASTNLNLKYSSNYDGQAVTTVTAPLPTGGNGSVLQFGGTPYQVWIDKAAHGVTFVNGTTYTFGFWAKVVSGNGSRTLSVRMTDNNTSGAVAASFTINDSSWTWCSVRKTFSAVGANPRLYYTWASSDTGAAPFQVYGGIVAAGEPTGYTTPDGRDLSLIFAPLGTAQ